VNAISHVHFLKRSFAVILLLSILWTAYVINTVPHRTNQVPPGITLEGFKEGVAKCAALKQRPTNYSGQTRTENPRRVPGSKTIVLKNGIILDGVGNRFHGTIVLKEGLIQAVGENITMDD